MSEMKKAMFIMVIGLLAGCGGKTHRVELKDQWAIGYMDGYQDAKDGKKNWVAEKYRP